jgi:hypothetical protein
MSCGLSAGPSATAAISPTSWLVARPAYQSYLKLHVGFAALSVIAGLDKFFHLLVDWDQYSAWMVTPALPRDGPQVLLSPLTGKSTEEIP